MLFRSLLIGIVEEGNGMAMDILMRLGVSSASIKKAIEKLTAKDQDKKRPLAGAGAGRPGAGLPFFSGSDASQQKGSGTDTLKQFATNLTQKARGGERSRDAKGCILASGHHGRAGAQCRLSVEDNACGRRRAGLGASPSLLPCAAAAGQPSCSGTAARRSG